MESKTKDTPNTAPSDLPLLTKLALRRYGVSPADLDAVLKAARRAYEDFYDTGAEESRTKLGAALDRLPRVFGEGVADEGAEVAGLLQSLNTATFAADLLMECFGPLALVLAEAIRRRGEPGPGAREAALMSLLDRYETEDAPRPATVLPSDQGSGNEGGVA